MMTARSAIGRLGRSLCTATKPIFYDMRHSNNAARIRLWVELKGDMRRKIDRRLMQYVDLKSKEFSTINPLKKARPLCCDRRESYYVIGRRQPDHQSSALGPPYRPGASSHSVGRRDSL